VAFRRWNKLAMLHKLEAAYGEQAAPSAADAIVASNITFTPIEADEVERDRLLPYLGNQGSILASEYGKVEFDIEMAGAGAAGDVPRYGSLLRVAGMSETITANTSVVYHIIESDVESGTLIFNSDGVEHVFLGAQTNIAMNWVSKAIPKFRFSMIGLLGDITDTLLPAVTAAGWVDPIVASKKNTTMSIHGWNAVAESLSIDLGNKLEPRFLIGDERIVIPDRKATGSAVVEARSLATINWFERARNKTRGLVKMTHGETVGNIVEVECSAVEIGKPSQGQTQGIVNYTLPLAICPTAGLDELTITVR